MATNKRDRQRANREAKQAELQKAKRRADMISRSKRIGIWIVVGVVLFIVANLVWGGGDSNDAAAFLVL